MIVTAIVGVLAAIALPMYSDYMVRSKMVELLNAVSQCKANVAEYLTARTALPATLLESGCTATTTTYGQGLDVVNGTISIRATVNVGGNPDQTNLVLALQPAVTSNIITAWSCDIASGTTIAAKYLPANCR